MFVVKQHKTFNGSYQLNMMQKLNKKLEWRKIHIMVIMFDKSHLLYIV